MESARTQLCITSSSASDIFWETTLHENPEYLNKEYGTNLEKIYGTDTLVYLRGFTDQRLEISPVVDFSALSWSCQRLLFIGNVSSIGEHLDLAVRKANRYIDAICTKQEAVRMVVSGVSVVCRKEDK